MCISYVLIYYIFVIICMVNIVSLSLFVWLWLALCEHHKMRSFNVVSGLALLFSEGCKSSGLHATKMPRCSTDKSGSKGNDDPG